MIKAMKYEKLQNKKKRLVENTGTDSSRLYEFIRSDLSFVKWEFVR
jgi:hypothetical protein